MRQQEPGLRGPIAPMELIKHFPGEPLAARSERKSAMMFILGVAGERTSKGLTRPDAVLCPWLVRAPEV